MVVRKLAAELAVGDTVVEIDTVRIPPALVELDGKQTIHSARVVELERGMEVPEVFDPVAHRQEASDPGLLASIVNAAAEALATTPAQAQANAAPNAGKSFPSVTVSIAAYEDDERLDQGVSTFTVRALALVEVLDHGLEELKAI